jgi:LPS export ABC transporter protein LptC
VSAAHPFSLRRFTLQAGLAGFLLMVGYLTLFWESSQPAVLLRAANANQVDLYAVQPRGSRFNESGQLQQSLRAERLTHYHNSDHSLLQAPRFTSLGDNGEVWHSSAREGTLVGEESVHLRGDAVIVDDIDHSRLRSEKLDWYPPSQRVETDVAVTLTQGGHTIRAIGMRAELDRHRVELLHQVEGTHVLP